MSITAPTKTSDFSGFLNPNIAAPIFEEAARLSVVQRLARRIPLGINGEAVPVVTSRPTAGWVSEGEQKPATSGAMALRTMTPEKLAAILVVSAEVVRANPGGYLEQARSDLAQAFADAFDAAALHGTNTPFDAYVAETTKAVTLGTATQQNGGVHADIVAGLSLLVNDGRRLTGFALDDSVEPVLLSATDSTGRPIYVDTPLDETSAAVRPGRLIGRPSLMSENVGSNGVVAFAGDWSKVVWGAIGGISYSVSNEATVTINGSLVSLWEHNLVAIKAEAEYGLLFETGDGEPVHFVKYLYSQDSPS